MFCCSFFDISNLTFASIVIPAVGASLKIAAKNNVLIVYLNSNVQTVFERRWMTLTGVWLSKDESSMGIIIL